MDEAIKPKQGLHKSKGGLIRSFVKTENGIIKDISISGDFFMFPEDAFFRMVQELQGIHAIREDIERKIQEIYIKEKIQSPGTFPADFAESIMKALEV
ncbi:MAG: lipoate--protein ligase family protein [Candidatus Methanoperedens sp.]|nr:lipoate--protein ligase family protein [Candidatus Methanoperedens sp.]